jgi:hypothetical protein
MEKIFRITNRPYGNDQKPATDSEVFQLSTDITIPAPFTAKEIKQKYESNSNTNSFTDSYKHKLEIIEAGAEKNKKVPLNEVMENGNRTDYALQITNETNLNRNVNSLGFYLNPYRNNAGIQLYKDSKILGSIQMSEGYMTFISDMTSITLRPQTADTSGIETGSRISCDRAKNNDEAVTLGQVKELITDTKRYRALATQTETNAPVADVLENTLGADLIYSRVGDFEYRIYNDKGIFLKDKTFLSAIGGTAGNAKLIRENDFFLKIINAADGTLDNVSVEINIYP